MALCCVFPGSGDLQHSGFSLLPLLWLVSPREEGLPPLPEGHGELPARRTSPLPTASEVERAGLQAWKWPLKGPWSNSEGGLVGGGTGSPCDSLR